MPETPVAPTTPPANSPPASKGTLWIGLVALLLGVAGLVCSLIPGEFGFRIAISAVGIVLAIVGLVLAIVSLAKKWRVGLSIAAVIVTAFSLVFSAGFLALGVFANQRIEAQVQQNNEETQERIAEEQAAQDEILSQSQWIEDARGEMDEADFTEVDAAILAEIMADPESYQEQGIIVDATMPTPLTHGLLNAQGICLVGVTLSAVGEEADLSTSAMVLDRGTADDCPLTERMLGLDGSGDGDLAENLTSAYQMWLVPTGLIPAEGGEDTPAFLLMRVE